MKLNVGTATRKNGSSSIPTRECTEFTLKSEEIDVIDFAAMKLRQMLRQEKCAATVSMLSNLLARYDAGEVAVAFWRGTPAWITVTVAE